MFSAKLKQKLYFDHIVLTVGNIIRTTEFYSKILGDPDYKDKSSIMYHIGLSKLFFTLPDNTLLTNDKFDANRIGLEHIAIGIQTLDDLMEIGKTLERYSIKNSGIHIDKHSSMEKIWLDDPDGIRLEFYIRPD